MLNFFYEGIYKVAYWSNYAFWVKHAPLLRPVWQVLAYAIPVGEIVLAFLFLVPSYRVTLLYSIIVLSILFVIWIISVYLFTNYAFWPFHALWKKPTWMQKMLISLGFGWLSCIGIILLKDGFFVRQIMSKTLRNTPANAR